MPGNKAGGIKARNANLEKYGADFYQRIGAKGGKAGNTGGFASGPEGRERASIWGRVGGTKSRRLPINRNNDIVAKEG